MKRLHDATAIAIATLSLLLCNPAAIAQEGSDAIDLPKPTGPHAVGTRSWDWIDASRPDEVSPQPNDFREVMAQLWYPARPLPSNRKAQYFPLYGWHTNVRTHSFVAAPVIIVDKPAPVIVICPGRGTPRHYYTTLAEDLASHGYAVVAIDSPHSGLVMYSDGRSREVHHAYIHHEKFPDVESVDAFFAEAALLGAQDVEFVLGQLAHLNKTDGMLFNRLDLERVGICGHSLGGRIAGAAAGLIPSIRAYLAFDNLPTPEVRRAGMNAAALVVKCDGFSEMGDVAAQGLVDHRRNDVLLVRVNVFHHNSLTDQAMLDPEEYPEKIAPKEGLALSCRLHRCFFDKYLRNEEQALAWMADDAHLQPEWFAKR